MLSSIAVPTGVLIGNVCAYLIKPEGFAVADLFLMAFGASVFGILTVLFSVRKPAKMAGSVSPVEAVRYVGEDESGEEKDRPHRRLTARTLAGSSRNRWGAL